MKEDTTRSIVQIKAGISVQKWEEQIRACQESGQTVKAWCGENGIPVGTYYSRLRRISVRFDAKQPPGFDAGRLTSDS